MIVQLGGNTFNVTVQSSGIARASIVAQEAAEAAVDLVEGEIAAAGAAQIVLVEAAGQDAIETAQAAAASAEADALQTAADRVQTGLDRVQTGQDRVQTGLDRVQTGLDRVQTGLDRTAAAGSAADAVAAMTQAELAAIAAGAAIYSSVANGEAGTVDGDMFFVSTAAGVQVYENQSGTGVAIGFLGTVSFPNVAALKAFTGPLTPVGTRIYAGRHRFEIVSSGEHWTTDGSQKVKVLPSAGGRYEIEAFNPDLTAVASSNALLAVVDALSVAEKRTVIISGGSLLVDATMTLAGDYIVERDGRFKADANLTFNGTIRAGRWQIFEGNAVDPAQNLGPIWAAGSVEAVFPEWFGAKTRNTNQSPFNSYAGLTCTFNSTSRSLIGTMWKVSAAQGIYDVNPGVTVPAGGLFHWEGAGRGTQFRGMAVSSVWPDYLVRFVSSTVESRWTRTTFNAGSSSRPVKYGILAEFELKQTHFEDCSWVNFSRACVASADWSCEWDGCEFTNSKVGLLFYASANNNDHNLTSCHFIGNEYDLVVGPGANVRAYGCQFQAAVAAPYTKTHIYAWGASGLSIHNPYMETQSQGGLAGMEFDDPDGGGPVKIYCPIIFNGKAFYTDMDAGTVTRTLSQNSGAVGVVAHIDSAFINCGAYYYAGAGGATYTNGAATLVAKNGQATTHTCNLTTGTGGTVVNVTGIAGGHSAQIGDRMKIVQGGNETAECTVLNTGANNIITSVLIGGNAAIYPGSVRSLTVTGGTIVGGILALYNNATVCNPRQIDINGTVKNSNNLDVIMLGPDIDTIKVPLRNININNLSRERLTGSTGSDLGVQNYFPGWGFASAPTLSTFSRLSGRFQGAPLYRFQLLAGQTASDELTGELAIAASGGGNSELSGRRVYLDFSKAESASNVKLRVSLEVVAGTSTVAKQTYNTSTSFTKAAVTGGEEVSIMIPPVACTLRYKVQVIAATAASQYVDIWAPVLAPVGWAITQFPRWVHDRPVRFSTTWDPASIAAGASLTNTLTVYGVRNGDLAQAAPPLGLSGLMVMASCPLPNTVVIDLYNKTGGAVDLASGTWNGMVTYTA